jgi:hypothetical protein
MTNREYGQFTHALVRSVPNSFVNAIGSTEPIDLSAARAEHAEYVQNLRTMGLIVIQVPADESLPDCPFVEDTAVICDGVALVTRPGHPARQRETLEICRALKEHAQIEVIEMNQANTYLDGGDVLFTGREFFVGNYCFNRVPQTGHTKRSSETAFSIVCSRLVRPYQLSRSRLLGAHFPGLSSDRHSNAARHIALEECDQYGRTSTDLLLRQAGKSTDRSGNQRLHSTNVTFTHRSTLSLSLRSTANRTNDRARVSDVDVAGRRSNELCLCQRLSHASSRVPGVASSVRVSCGPWSTSDLLVQHVQTDGCFDLHVLAHQQALIRLLILCTESAPFNKSPPFQCLKWPANQCLLCHCRIAERNEESDARTSERMSGRRSLRRASVPGRCRLVLGFTYTDSRRCEKMRRDRVRCDRHPPSSQGPVAQWTTRLTTDQKIPGSNPGRIAVAYSFFALFHAIPRRTRNCFWCKKVGTEEKGLFFGRPTRKRKENKRTGRNKTKKRNERSCQDSNLESSDP